MKELSIKEFGELCTNIHPGRYLFSSEDQDGGKYIGQINWALDFKTVTPNAALETICFGDNIKRDLLRLTMVKGVRISDDKSLVGTTFSIVCRGLYKNSPDSIFTFVAL